jgi:hypothetical protein
MQESSLYFVLEPTLSQVSFMNTLSNVACQVHQQQLKQHGAQDLGLSQPMMHKLAS